MPAQPWICGSCRSINQPREGRCYRCRTPRDLVEADPATLVTAGAGSKPTASVRPAGRYRSSGDLALFAQALIGAAMAVAVVGAVLRADLVGRLLEGEAVAGDTAMGTVGLVGIVGLFVGGAALVALALWLSRVVANVPTVGLGWPNVTPTAAIYEVVIPGVNLYRVPAIFRDVINRLDPNGRGDALIAATWLTLVGGVLLPRVAGWAAIFILGDPDALVSIRVLAGQLGLGLTLAGGVLLIVLVQWLETRMEQLGRAHPEGVADPGAAAGAVSETPPTTNA